MFPKQLVSLFNLSDATFLGLDHKDDDRDERELCAKFSYADDPAAPYDHNRRFKLKREDLHGLPGCESTGPLCVYKARDAIAGRMQLKFMAELTRDEFHVIHAERLQEDIYRLTFHPYWETSLDRDAKGYVLKKSELQSLLDKAIPRLQYFVTAHAENTPMASCMDHNVEVLKSLIESRKVLSKYRDYVSDQFGALHKSMTMTP